jgi:hypothetical protein
LLAAFAMANQNPTKPTEVSEKPVENTPVNMQAVSQLAQYLMAKQKTQS